MSLLLRSTITFSILLSFGSVWGAKTPKVLPSTIVVYKHQTQVNTVHPDGSTNPAPDQIGDLVTTYGYLYDESNTKPVGNYRTQKTTIGLDPPNSVRSNLVYYDITS